MNGISEFIGQPLLTAAAQTLVGALGGYYADKMWQRYFRSNIYEGAFDLWQRGFHCKNVEEGDIISFDGLISPYIQLFPRDPYQNATRWNTLYNFEGKISSQEFSNLEFYAGSDDTIRTGTLNGETLVGLYARYGYIGEGILGVSSTKTLLSSFPNFFNPTFFGAHAVIKGEIARCPAQHGFVAQGMFLKAGLAFNCENYKNIPYLRIKSIKLFNNEKDRICSLLGSPWAATNEKQAPYLVQYGYLSNQAELRECLNNMKKSKVWDKVCVFYDAITAPNPSLSFTKQFLI